MAQRRVQLRRQRAPQAEDAARAPERLHEVAFDAIALGACVIDGAGRLQLFNRRFLDIYGCSRSEVPVGAALQAAIDLGVARGMLVAGDAARMHRAIARGLGRRRAFVVPVRLAHGRALSIECAPIGGGKWLLVHEDVSVSHRLEEELQLQVRCLHHALSNMSQGLCLFGPDERLIMRNEQYCTIYGIDPAFVRPGLSHRQIIEHWVATGNQPGLSAEELYQQRMREIRSEHVRIGRLIRRDGRVIEAISRITPEGGWVSTNEDITERCQAEARISHMARHDPLTDLPNRTLFRERVSQALAGLGNGEHAVALFLLDLDGFKSVNDRFGHAVGDELLEVIARRLADCVRGHDTVARLGGDEFAVLLQPGGADAAARLARRLITRVSRPVALGGCATRPGLSIGIAVAPRDGVTEASLMKAADDALYRSKAAGRGVYSFHDNDLDPRRAALPGTKAPRRIKATGA